MNWLPDSASGNDLPESVMMSGLSRLENCFAQIKGRYYQAAGHAIFDHLHSDHFAMLLYFLSNQAVVEGRESLGIRLAYLNKIMHGVDIYPHVNLPGVFLLVHPLGTCLGRATYGNYLVVYQGVTVGANGSECPTLGEGTVLYAGAKVMGATKSGENVIYGANALVLRGSIPDNSLVVGQFPSCRVLPKTLSIKRAFFVEA